MLRFIKHNLTSIDGVSIYPIVSLLIFAFVFLFVIIRVVRMNKPTITMLSELPFNKSEVTDQQAEEKLS